MFICCRLFENTIGTLAFALPDPPLSVRFITREPKQARCVVVSQTVIGIVAPVMESVNLSCEDHALCPVKVTPCGINSASERQLPKGISNVRPETPPASIVGCTVSPAQLSPFWIEVVSLVDPPSPA